MQIGSSREMQADLNVTPLIDVVLVLLIIFMVVVPKNDRQLPVVVPEEQTAEPPPEEAESLVMEVAADGSLAINHEPVKSLEALQERLATVLAARKDKDRVVFLEAADDASYDRAMQAMDTARKAGAKHVGLVEQPPAAPAAP